jgi:uncharacterized alkaline shock family protein YloU
MKLQEAGSGPSYVIAASVLEAIAKGALSDDARIRLHSPSGLGRARGVEILVDERSLRVTLQLDARFGEELLGLGAEVQERVTRTLSRMTGFGVDSVCVIFARVFPLPEADDSSVG